MVNQNVRIELNLRGLNELMKGPEMQDHLQTAGEAVAQAAGSEYGVRVHVADFVAIANVYPDSEEAAKENFETNRLLEAVSSVGLPLHK